MTSYADVCARWVHNTTCAPQQRKGVLSTKRVRVYGFDPDTIFSYGTHFPLATVLRNPDGSVRAFLVNGDRWSSSTTNHQRHVRTALNGQPSIIVPFTALAAADIDRYTVRLVHVLPDRNVTVERTVHKPAHWWSRDQRGYYTLDYEAWRDNERSGEVPHRYVTANADGTYTFTATEHWLGESLFTAEVVTSRSDTDWRQKRRTAAFLSGFDHAEPAPLYFLSELADATPSTVAEAYESLKTPTVRLAEAMGRTVRRQGDIFAIPTDLDTRTLSRLGATRTRMGQLLGTNHVATETAVLPDGRTFVRGVLWHRPEFRGPDHVRQRLAKGQWHLAQKNTVPIAA